MRCRTIELVLLFCFIFISGCCLKFTDQTPGATYNVGDIINASSTDIAVERFQWGNANWTSQGSAVVDTRNYAQGSGNDLNARNVNLHFRFDYPVKEITLKFGELGGNVNIQVNDDFRNVRDLVSLSGNTVGNALVTVPAIQQGNNWYGTVVIEGNIDDFMIGGQEFWIDNVCHRK